MMKKTFTCSALFVCLFMFLGLKTSAQTNQTNEKGIATSEKVLQLDAMEEECLKLPMTDEIADKLEWIQSQKSLLISQNESKELVIKQVAGLKSIAKGVKSEGIVQQEQKRSLPQINKLVPAEVTDEIKAARSKSK